MRILFVCLGNICRSPIAEGVMCHMIREAGLNWEVQSAGTESYHVGAQPHPFSQSICRQHGIDIRHQCARLFTPGDLGAFDHVYAMAEDVLYSIRTIAGPDADYRKVQLFLEDLHPGERRSVPDPWYGDESKYPAVYTLISDGCAAILEKLTTKEHRAS